MAQIVLDRLAAQFRSGEILQTGSQHGDEWVRVRRDAWVAVATFLRDDPVTDMKMFIDLTAVDRFSTEPRFSWILSCSIMSPSSTCSGRGGQPGM